MELEEQFLGELQPYIAEGEALVVRSVGFEEPIDGLPDVNQWVLTPEAVAHESLPDESRGAETDVGTTLATDGVGDVLEERQSGGEGQGR